MRNIGCIATALALALSLNPASSFAAIAGLQRVASGLAEPIYVTHAPGDRDRLFIVENGSPDGTDGATALVKILNINTGIIEAIPFLTIPGVNTSGEGGVLGMAFHPDYFSTDVNNPGRGKFYINLTASDEVVDTPFSTYIREYTVTENPNVADSTFKPVLSFTQPQVNHNGGWLGFGPNDGYLYIMTGDGGNAHDSGPGHSTLPDAPGNAQDITNNLLGKVLRVDINGDDFSGTSSEALAKNYAIPPTNPFVGKTGDDEIWAYGLRNPFRASFDRKSGDLWIGDVGQNDREEIDFQPATSSGGENYGWRLREGDIATPTGGVGGPPPANHVPPIYAYTQPGTSVGPVSPSGFSGTVVTGGYVYRGPDPSLQGEYLFLDAGGNNYWMADSNPFGPVVNIDSQMLPDTGLALFPVSYGEDADGNLYISYIASGEIYRIRTDQLLIGDFDADGEVDQDDYIKWRAGFGSMNPNPAADGNGNSTFDAADYVAWRDNLGTSVQTGAGQALDQRLPEPPAAVIFLLLAAIIERSVRAPRIHHSSPDA